MPLPTIEVPKYKLKIPSTGKLITFRPFLVKEEKILLTALETDAGEDALIDALFNLVDSCIETKNIDVKSLAPFDLEYIFVKLREKSVGEDATINIKCTNIECGLEFPKEVDLSSLEIVITDDHTNKIKLSDELGIMMKYPNVKDSGSLDLVNKTDDLFTMIAKCIDSIYTKEEVFSNEDHTTEELEDFIGQLSPGYFKKIMNFFETMPTMKNDIKCICPACKEETVVTVRGIEDFFV